MRLCRKSPIKSANLSSFTVAAEKSNTKGENYWEWQEDVKSARGPSPALLPGLHYHTTPCHGPLNTLTGRPEADKWWHLHAGGTPPCLSPPPRPSYCTQSPGQQVAPSHMPLLPHLSSFLRVPMPHCAGALPSDRGSGEGKVRLLESAEARLYSAFSGLFIRNPPHPLSLQRV